MTPVKPGSKYLGLYTYLSRRGDPLIRLSMKEIEDLVGGGLPPSAKQSRSYWSNRARGALQAEAWMAAGYHVAEVNFEAGYVAFKRPRLEYTVEHREGETIWDAELVRALRAHLGVNQAGLAEILGVRQQTVSEWETGAYAPTRARSKHLTLVAERADFPLGEGRHGYRTRG